MFIQNVVNVLSLVIFCYSETLTLLPVPNIMPFQQDLPSISLVLLMCESPHPGSKEAQGTRFQSKPHLLEYSRQINHTLVLLKSVLISRTQSSEYFLKFTIFSNNKSNVDFIVSQVRTWNPKFTKNLKIAYEHAIFPEGTEWLGKLYAPCTSLRLFLPEILLNETKVVYVDTDIIFLNSVYELNSVFEKFSEGNSISAAFEPLLDRRKLYAGPKRIPLRDLPDIQAGVLLMDFEKLRVTNFTGWVKSLVVTDIRVLRCPDQTILAMYFYEFPDVWHHLPCTWNFIPRFYRNRPGVWETCNTDKLALIHGNGGRFLQQRGGFAKQIYSLYEKQNMSSLFSVPKFTSKIQKIISNAKRRSDIRFNVRQVKEA